jgi:hypothetical protein
MSRAVVLGAARLAVVLWLCIHAVLGLIMPGQSFSVVGALLVPALVAALVLIDQRIAHETVFLANVGIRPSLAPLAAGATAVGLEFAARLVLG